MPACGLRAAASAILWSPRDPVRTAGHWRQADVADECLVENGVNGRLM